MLCCLHAWVSMVRRPPNTAVYTNRAYEIITIYVFKTLNKIVDSRPIHISNTVEIRTFNESCKCFLYNIELLTLTIRSICTKEDISGGKSYTGLIISPTSNCTPKPKLKSGAPLYKDDASWVHYEHDHDDDI